MRIYSNYIKRFLDLLISFILVIILSPLFLIISLLIRNKLGSPVIFSQIRPGKNNELFKMYKFRTMLRTTNEKGDLLSDEERSTSFGKKLRALSLDELPELINILKGDMSIVGPRPLLKEYLPLYSEVQLQRHSVKPGLTGLAQVSGRNNLEWSEKFKLDVSYVNNINLISDFKIILKTFLTVFKKEGISSNNSATMTKFIGNEDKNG